MIGEVRSHDIHIMERVRLPEKRVLVGLGADGVVYMNYAPTPGMVYLERARVQR